MKTLASKTAKSRQLVTIDVVRRHEAVVEEINKMNKSKMSILDVGGRINSLSSFIDKEHSLVVLNTNLSDLQVEYPPAKGILGSGCNIPFKNNSFDVVTSIACLEHIPKKERLQYLSELKRIAKQKVIIYVPIGEKAEEYDKKLYRLSTNDHIKKMTGEHISCGLPRVEQVKDVFPFCKIKPLHNVNVWLITLTIQGIPRLRRLSWLIYNNILKWFDNTPPFYAIVLSWDKSYYSSETKLRSSEINSHYNMMSVNSSKETSPVMNMVEDGLFLVLILFRTTFIFLKKIKSIKNALKKTILKRLILIGFYSLSTGLTLLAIAITSLLTLLASILQKLGVLSWFKLRKKLKLEILFFAWQPENNASSRYRAYKVAEHLRKQGFECIVRPPVSIGFYERYYEKGGRINQLIFFSVVFLNRIKDIIMSVRYDVVIMQRDLFMLFYYIPSILERFLKRLNPNIIFDFDDFIFVPPPQSVQGKNRFAIWMAKRKTYANIRLSKHIIVSNEYLHKYILKYDKAVTIIPTCIDIERYTIKTKRHSPKIIIGWIGNPGNLFYLNSLERVFKKLADKYDFILKVVCSKDFKLDGIKVVNSNWRIETEIEDIQSFDIGIMPLTNNEYTKGKGGFKALQYMAVGIPAVCSPVGILTAIIEDGINGFLAHSDEEWIKKLSFLIEDEKLRNKLGANGRHTVEEYFSFNVNIPKFKTVIEEISSGTGKAAL